MNKLELIKNKQKQVGIVDIIAAAVYIGLVVLLIVTMVYGLNNLNTDANGDGETDAVEAIGGIFVVFFLAFFTVLLIPVAVIFGIGVIFWAISGGTNLAAYTNTKKKPISKGFMLFVAILQVLSFAVCFFGMIVGFTSIKGSSIALISALDAIFFLCGAVICLVGAIFKFKLVKLLKLPDDEEDIAPAADIQDAYEVVEENKEEE